MPLEGKYLGRYQIKRVIGKGGMGKVYLAEDSQVRRQVALKVIEISAAQPGDAAVANALRLFAREAIAIAQLDHPNILPLYDHGEGQIDGDRVAYLVMPYRPEGSLNAWLSRRADSPEGQLLTLKQVLWLLPQAAVALQYAHDHQIVHQDVKPANFLIRSKARDDAYPDLQLADFGIAHLGGSMSHTSHQVRGTPAYMAPEQWTAGPVPASDQYALAVMAYELLTGQTPFQGNPMRLMFQHTQEPPPPPSTINPLLPSAIDTVLLHALAKKPKERFPSVVSFAQDFQTALQGIDEGTTIRMLPRIPLTPQVPGAQRISRDIQMTLPISAKEALNGATFAIRLPDGREVTVQIPPGAQHGQVLTLRGQGKSTGPESPAGNVYFTLVIEATPSPAPLRVDPSAPTESDQKEPTQRLAPFPSSPTPITTTGVPVSPRVPGASPPGTPAIPITLSQPVSPGAGTSPTAPAPNQTPPVIPIVPPTQPVRRRPVLTTAALAALIVLLVGGGILAIWSSVSPGFLPWSPYGGTPQATGDASGTTTANTANATAQTNQANDAATAAAQQAAANSTATAVAEHQPYKALLPGLCDQGGANWSGDRGTCLSDGLRLTNTSQTGAYVWFLGTGTLPENYTVSVETSRLQGSVCAEFWSALKNPANTAAEYRIELCSNVTGLGLKVFYADATGDRSIYQEAADSNGTFTLQIACQSPGCTFSVNGRQLTSLTPNQYLLTAGIALGVSQGNTASGSVVFSNFIFTLRA